MLRSVIKVFSIIYSYGIIINILKNQPPKSTYEELEVIGLIFKNIIKILALMINNSQNMYILKIWNELLHFSILYFHYCECSTKNS